MLHKNLPEPDRRKILFRRRLLDTVAWMKYMATFSWKNAAAIFRAHRDFAVMRKQYVRNAAKNLLGTDVDSRRNIIVDYYLRGKKIYSRL